MAEEAAVVLLAAGSGSRLAAGRPKALVPVAGRPLVVHSLRTIARSGLFSEVVLVVPPGAAGREVALLARTLLDGLPSPVPVLRVTEGGARRRDSVRRGLAECPRVLHVLVHDAARPLAGAELFRRVLEGAARHGAAVPLVPVADALVREQDGIAAEDVPRESLRAVQTPQGFRRDLLVRAHDAVDPSWDAPDDGALVRRFGGRVAAVPGERTNLKVTWPEDLLLAGRLLGGGEAMETRVGFGWDVHRMVEGRPLVLAGVTVDPDVGPLGHSDGDPLSHAIVDALLGAAALGDIGTHFPDDDQAFAGAPGPELLVRTRRILADAGWSPWQVDAVLVLDRPKLAPFRERIREALARVLRLPPGRVSLKAKRTEGLGSLAGGRGIACHAVAQVRRTEGRG